jgi:5,10-methylene-tetrahydrofolate dehydrogenase/methenyl tetrahydrofolate cyclohydrolase
MLKEKSNEDYLKKCKVTENDPAILFDWNFEVLQQFVEGVNQNVVLPQAFFITTAPGNMTVTSLLNDLMILLSRVSGGRNGNNYLNMEIFLKF